MSVRFIFKVKHFALRPPTPKHIQGAAVGHILPTPANQLFVWDVRIQL
jgi:hypothetical protein